MKTPAELVKLKLAITESNQDDDMIVINKAEIVALVDQALDQQKIINRWYGFMRFMADRSSWKRQIAIILDEYLFGTTDSKVQEAAKLYAKRIRMHEKELAD